MHPEQLFLACCYAIVICVIRVQSDLLSPTAECGEVLRATTAHLGHVNIRLFSSTAELNILNQCSVMSRVTVVQYILRLNANISALSLLLWWDKQYHF